MPNNNGPIRPEIQRKIFPFVGRGGGLLWSFLPSLPLITEVKSQVHILCQGGYDKTRSSSLGTRPGPGEDEDQI